MPLIPFTQFLMSKGRKKNVTVDRPEPIYAKAMDLIKKGARFEIEMLPDYSSISMETLIGEDTVISGAIIKNGPEVLGAVDRMIEEAALKYP